MALVDNENCEILPSFGFSGQEETQRRYNIRLHADDLVQ